MGLLLRQEKLTLQSFYELSRGRGASCPAFPQKAGHPAIASEEAHFAIQ